MILLSLTRIFDRFSDYKENGFHTFDIAAFYRLFLSGSWEYQNMENTIRIFLREATNMAKTNANDMENHN